MWETGGAEVGQSKGKETERPLLHTFHRISQITLECEPSKGNTVSLFNGHFRSCYTLFNLSPSDTELYPRGWSKDIKLDLAIERAVSRCQAIYSTESLCRCVELSGMCRTVIVRASIQLYLLHWPCEHHTMDLRPTVRTLLKLVAVLMPTDTKTALPPGPDGSAVTRFLSLPFIYPSFLYFEAYLLPYFA